MIFLYKMFGISAFIGIACVPLSTPLSFYVSRQSYRERNLRGLLCLLMLGADVAWARARDARVSAIKEYLLCYKVIKVCHASSTADSSSTLSSRGFEIGSKPCAPTK